MTAARVPVTLCRFAAYDRRAVSLACQSTDPQTVAKVAKLAQQTEDLPPVASTMETTSHLHALDSAIEDLFVGAFPKQPSGPKDHWISQRTLDIFVARSKQWVHASRLAHKTKPAALWFSFRWWASTRRLA